MKSLSLSTIGTDNAVDANQIKRARYCIQVCLCALYKKLKDAAMTSGTSLTPLDWLEERSKSSEMCFYWKMVLQLQMEILVFIRSVREARFILNIESLRRLLVWFFIFDHHNYEPYLAVHIFDLLSLKTKKKTDLYKIFTAGAFCFYKKIPIKDAI